MRVFNVPMKAMAAVCDGSTDTVFVNEGHVWSYGADITRLWHTGSKSTSRAHDGGVILPVSPQVTDFVSRNEEKTMMVACDDYSTRLISDSGCLQLAGEAAKHTGWHTPRQQCLAYTEVEQCQQLIDLLTTMASPHDAVSLRWVPTGLEVNDQTFAGSTRSSTGDASNCIYVPAWTVLSGLSWDSSHAWCFMLTQHSDSETFSALTHVRHEDVSKYCAIPAQTCGTSCTVAGE